MMSLLFCFVCVCSHVSVSASDKDDKTSASNSIGIILAISCIIFGTVFGMILRQVYEKREGNLKPLEMIGTTGSTCDTDDDHSDNLNINLNQPVFLNDDDREATVWCDRQPHFIKNVLVAIISIGDYDHNYNSGFFQDVVSMTKDYTNVINTFVNVWKYNVIYKITNLNSNSNIIYSNDINFINNHTNYKLN